MKKKTFIDIDISDINLYRIQINKEVYYLANYNKGIWYRQATCKPVTKKRQNKLNNLILDKKKCLQ